MKIRNGFVSNSSSSSFIFITPKNKKLGLGEIENYIGGFKEDIDDHLKGLMTFLLWNSQYSKLGEEGYLRESVKPGELEEHSYCKATWEQVQQRWDCQRYFNVNNQCCQKCPYCVVEKRPGRSDDYYDVKDSIISDSFKEKITPENSVYVFSIDNNERVSGLSYEDSYDIHAHAGSFFKNHDVVWEDND
jgi:hypothetical protein